MIAVDSAALEGACSDFGTALTALTALADALRELDGQLAVSLAGWSGPARHACDAAWAEWRRSAAGLAGTLAHLGGVLSAAEAGYGRCEDGIVRAFTEG